MHAAALLSETLFIFLFVAALVALVPAAGRVGPLGRGRLVTAGILFGLSVLVRPVSLAALPVLALAWWLQGRSEGPGIGLRRAAGQAGWLLGCTVLLVAPWTIRNAVRMHAFVPLSTNNGDNLCIGYSPDANGAFGLAPACITKDVAVNGSRAEVRHDHEATHLAVKYATADPGRIPWLVTRRFYYLMQRDDDALRAVQSYGAGNFIPRAPGPRARPRRVGVVASGGGARRPGACCCWCSAAAATTCWWRWRASAPWCCPCSRSPTRASRCPSCRS